MAEACNFIQKETLIHAFSREFCKTFKTTFYETTPACVTNKLIHS